MTDLCNNKSIVLDVTVFFLKLRAERAKKFF